MEDAREEDAREDDVGEDDVGAEYAPESHSKRADWSPADTIFLRGLFKEDLKGTLRRQAFLRKVGEVEQLAKLCDSIGEKKVFSKLKYMK